MDTVTAAFCYAIGDDEEAIARTVGVIAGVGLGAVSKYADDVADLTDDTFGSVYKKKIASESSEYVDDIVRNTDVKQPKNTSSVGNEAVGNVGDTGSKFQEIFDLADNYTLSDDTFNNHIIDRHGFDSKYKNKSHFNADFDIRNGIDSTLKDNNFIVGPNTAGREGYVFEQTFTSSIGVNSKGKPLYTLKVVIDEVGNVITAFPKK